MLVGYMRVSTAEQDLALQRDALLAAGIAPEGVYEDICSGTVTNRPGLARALDVAREGNALVIWKLDRVGVLGWCVYVTADALCSQEAVSVTAIARAGMQVP